MSNSKNTVVKKLAPKKRVNKKFNTGIIFGILQVACLLVMYIFTWWWTQKNVGINTNLIDKTLMLLGATFVIPLLITIFVVVIRRETRDTINIIRTRVGLAAVLSGVLGNSFTYLFIYLGANLIEIDFFSIQKSFYLLAPVLTIGLSSVKFKNKITKSIIISMVMFALAFVIIFSCKLYQEYTNKNLWLTILFATLSSLFLILENHLIERIFIRNPYAKTFPLLLLKMLGSFVVCLIIFVPVGGIINNFHIIKSFNSFFWFFQNKERVIIPIIIGIVFVSYAFFNTRSIKGNGFVLNSIYNISLVFIWTFAKNLTSIPFFDLPILNNGFKTIIWHASFWPSLFIYSSAMYIVFKNCSKPIRKDFSEYLII